MLTRRSFRFAQQRRCWSALLLLLVPVSFVGCAPAERLADPVDWPGRWDSRTLWTTPHAFIYAGNGAAAGEIDRLAERVKGEYTAELGQPTPPLLLIVRDASEPYPGDDVRELLRSTLRLEMQRDPEQSSAGQDSDGSEQSTPDAIEDALMGTVAAATATGTTLEVLAGTIPLTCDEQALKDVCATPDAMSDQHRTALIIPTRACLRTNIRKAMRSALKLYGIGPVAQVVFAPVLAIAEGKAVDRLDRLREVALFNHWLFEHADLPIERKREIARTKLEEWGGSVEAAAVSIVGAAR